MFWFWWDQAFCIDNHDLLQAGLSLYVVGVDDS